MMRARPVSILLLTFAVAAPLADEPQLTGSEILERMRVVYAGCSTYRDEGLVSIRFDTRESAWTSRKPFSVVFSREGLGPVDLEASGARPGQAVRMRYEFWHQSGSNVSSRWDRYVVWSDGIGVRSWWSLRAAEERHDSWGDALSGPTGVSGTSAIQITSLLLAGDEVSCLWTDLHNASVVGQETIDRRPTYKVEMLNGCGDQRTIWVDQESFLLRQITFGHELDSGTAETTIRFEPSVDLPLDPAKIRFQPDPGDTQPPLKWRKGITRDS